MKSPFEKLRLIDDMPITHEALLEVGYTYYECGYYCAPPPADGAIYRLEHRATIFESNGDGSRMLPKAGTEKWRAYTTHKDSPTIRRFKTMGELKFFHKGMCGAWLF